MEKQQLLASLHSAHEYFEPYKETMDLYESIMQQIKHKKAKRNHSALSNVVCLITCIALFAVVYLNPNLDFSIQNLTFSKVSLLVLWVVCFIGVPAFLKIYISKLHQKRTDRKIAELTQQSAPLYNEILECYLEFEEASFLTLPFSFCYPNHIAKLTDFVEYKKAKTLKEAIALLQAELTNEPTGIFHHLVLNAQQITQLKTQMNQSTAMPSIS